LESILNESKNDVKPNFTAQQAKETFASRWKDPLKDITAWMTPITNVSVARITEPRLRRLVQKKSSSSTPGPDGTGYQIYKNCAITRIIVINRVLEEQIVPFCWKTGSIMLIYKKGDAKNPTYFRSICLSNTASKLFTSYLQNHIDHHMSKNKLLSPTQKGFRNNVSGCVEHQFLLSKLIGNARKNSKQELVVVLTDLAVQSATPLFTSLWNTVV
jgi:hypothetical protein